MKKILTAVLVLSVFLFSNPTSAGDGFLDNNSTFKKHTLKKNLLQTSSTRFAEDNMAFGDGKIVLSLGYGGLSGGFVKTLLRAYEDSAGYNFSSFGPIHFRGEIGLAAKVGLVLSVNHNSFKASWKHSDGITVYNDQYKRSVTSVLARLNLHFGTSEKLDAYWGIGAGYRLATHTFTSTDTDYDLSFKSPFNLGFETTLGVRYYLMDGFGLYGEIGLAQSVIQGGVVVSF